jgi:hypothetical protein
MTTVLARCAHLLSAAALAALIAVPAAAAGSDAPAANPRLASLQIEIWPEYDRPAAALVILRGQLAADVALPAAVSLRIPAATGGPAAVAYAASAGGNNLNLPYDRAGAGDFITLKFDVPERFFHVEFYDPLPANAPGREFTYVWTGDLATDRLTVTVQEPAAATDVSVVPTLDAAAAGPDGLRYRSAELGASAAGKAVAVNVRYTKADARTSAELLKPQMQAAASPATADTTRRDLAIALAVAVAILVLGSIGISAWWYRRKSRPEAQPDAGGFCRKCRTPFRTGDRFCSRCGAKLA